MTTAPEHQHTDPFTGEIVHFYSIFGEDSYYQIYVVPPGSPRRTLLGRVPVNPQINQPLYQHSFGMTENYVIMSEVPCTLAGNFKDFKWMPELGVTWRVIGRSTGLEVYNYTSPPFFMFHHINAYEDAKSNSIVVDLITYPNTSILQNFYLDVILNHYSLTTGDMWQSRPTRFVLPLDTPGIKVTGKPIAMLPMEMPIINDMKSTRPYQYFYCITLNDEASTWMDAIAKVDTYTGKYLKWFVFPSLLLIGLVDI